jgi:hypothetical protein
MNKNRLPESPELTTEGVMPVQSFVAAAAEIPPGTPARPRSDRPGLSGAECASPSERNPKKDNDAGQAPE